MNNETLEVITHLFVPIGYTAALVAAIMAHVRTKMWSRKVSTTVIAMISVIWIGFYLWLAIRDHGHPGATTAILLSRAGHYFTAAGLFIAASMISRADRYGVDATGNMENGD